jgi:hypothetical protein
VVHEYLYIMDTEQPMLILVRRSRQLPPNRDKHMIRKFVLGFCITLSCASFGSQGEAALVDDPPKGVSIPNIIQSFAAKEKEFKQAREMYAYTQDVTVRASCRGAQPGLYHLIADVMFNGKGNWLEKVKAVDSTLQCIAITKEDLDSFRNQSMLVLTSDEIQDYQINFVGQQQQDNLHFYVFDVSPVAVQLGKPQFEGRIWVDAHDLLIVKSHGTIVVNREKKRKKQENTLPAVTTWREQIDCRYWFPTYSRANDVMHFSSGDVQIEELIKLTNYKAIVHP